MSAFASVYRPLVHGHRGCRGLRPENTLPAFLHAIELGVDVLELDIVVSQDHELVVAHDPWLPAGLGTGPAGEFLTPGHERDLNIYQLPYAAIRRCALGLWPPPAFPEQQPVPAYRPLLGEVLGACKQACQQLGRLPVSFSIEIKFDPAGDDLYHPRPDILARLLLTELARCQPIGLVTLLSFDPRILRELHQQAPSFPLCYLVENSLPAISLLDALGFIPQVLGPDYRLLSSSIVAQYRQEYPSLQLVPWTVNRAADFQHVLSWQVDGITTDYPDRLLKILH